MKFLHLLVVISFPAVYVPGQAQKSDLLISNTTEQSSNQSGIELRHENIDSSIDTLMTLTDKFEKHIEQPIQETLKMLIDLGKKHKEIAFGHLKNFEHQLQEKTMELIRSVSKTDENSSNLGIDISKCIEDHINGFSNMSQRILYVTTKCITDKIQEVEDIILETIHNVTGNHVKAGAIWRELEDCKNSSDIQKSICVGNITVKIELSLVEIPIELTRAATKVKYYTPGVWSAYSAACTAGKVADIVYYGSTLAANIALCTESKSLDHSKDITTTTETLPLSSEHKIQKEKRTLEKNLTEGTLESSDQETRNNKNGTASLTDKLDFSMLNDSRSRNSGPISGETEKKKMRYASACDASSGSSLSGSSIIYFIYFVSVNAVSLICVQWI